MAVKQPLNIPTFSIPRLIWLSVAQSVLLSAGQIMLKLAIAEQPGFSWSTDFLRGLLTNVWWVASLLTISVASLMWLRILRRFPLSAAYPMASLTYVFTLVFSTVFLDESASWNKWLGVGLIIVGCFFVTGGNTGSRDKV